MNDLEKIENISDEILDRLFDYRQKNITDKIELDEFDSVIIDCVRLLNSISEWGEKYDKK